ncbi:hypothetical protein ABZ470_26485 [Streptosporangium sp. NPDC020072]|uniref:hypothetical protein n=1 Tax=Streptosporangium sp. NPDC020072 TaxID=3154788 RepID=UPI00341FD316
MTSDAIEAATRALANRVYDRDHTDIVGRTSTTDFAFEFVLWLRANGWTEPPTPTAKLARVPLPNPPSGLRGAAIARHALAQLDKKNNHAH